ncbi:LuxR family transcriptional regulator [Lentzea sp. NBRC 105346]|nr:LuxR family transcriptional regulator [Lentzea sp. NBRC 105346]
MAELAELAAAVRTSRLVSLVGTAGAGKTRLAMEFAGRYEHAQVVELASVTRVADAVAAALGVSAWHEVAEQALLVLDNCEHVLDDCRNLVPLLHTECPGLRVLVTSREALHLPGEVVLPVYGLGTDAVELFADRARRVTPEFKLTDETLVRVTEVCERLDGLPLAVELAARLVRPLPLEEIVARLDEPFSVLVSGWRSAPGRHRDLRAAIGWSHDLLTPEEQAVFRRLSVLAGGFDLDAARAVAAGSHPRPDAVVRNLERKSLVTRHGADRFRMLESIRHFAHERLTTSGEETVVRQRMVAWLVGLVGDVRRAGSLTWQRMLLEHDNLVHAIDHLMPGDERRLLLAGALAAARINYGYAEDTRRLLVQELEHDHPDSPSRVLAVREAARIAQMLGDADAAKELLRKAIERARASGRDEDLTPLLRTAGYLAVMRGDYADAIRIDRERAEVACVLGDAREHAHALNGLAWALLAHGDWAQAARLVELARSVPAEGEDSSSTAHTAAVIALERGDLAAAHDLLTEALSVNRDSMMLSRWRLEGVAMLALRRKQPERALRLLTAVGHLCDQRGIVADPWWRGRVREAESAAVAAVPAALAESIAEWAQEVELADVVGYALGTENPRAVDELSEPEVEVLRLLARGRTSREIAAGLGLSERTVESRVRSIRTRLGIESRSQLVAWAAKTAELT